MLQLVVKALNCDLPTKPKFVLVCLADQADEYGVCYPGIATLSRYTSMPERTLQRMLGYLKAHGWIETFWQPTDKVRYKKILHYRLCIEGLPKNPQPDYNNCPVELRAEVIEKFQHTCSYCRQTGTGKLGPDNKSWEIDRVIPGSKGGHYVATNVTLSCRKCNNWKRARMAPQGIQTLSAILDKTGCHSEQNVVPSMAHDSYLTRVIEPAAPRDLVLWAIQESERTGVPADELLAERKRRTE